MKPACAASSRDGPRRLVLATSSSQRSASMAEVDVEADIGGLDEVDSDGNASTIGGGGITGNWTGARVNATGAACCAWPGLADSAAAEPCSAAFASMAALREPALPPTGATPSTPVSAGLNASIRSTL